MNRVCWLRRRAPSARATHNMKSRRQGAILEFIDREPFSNQEQLRRRLARVGFEATQATISRDIKDLGPVA